MNTDTMSDLSAPLLIGWAEIDITPPKLPIVLAGQFHARLSEGVLSPLKASICVLENGDEQTVFACCDVVSISADLYAQVRSRLVQSLPEINPDKLVLHATHTHTGPNVITGADSILGKVSADDYGVDLPVGYSSAEGIEWIATQLLLGIETAWKSRQAGGIAFGLDYAVVGRNRRWVDKDGNAYMYGLHGDNKEIFRHIEGYEDHSINLLATYDAQNQLTGLIVNIPSPSQEVEGIYLVSADFWHETRAELRKRFGEKIFILPQVSSAGDLTPHLIFENAAHERMLQLRKHTALQETANRISDAVGRILPAIRETITQNPVFKHRTDTISLTANPLTEKDAQEAQQEANRLLERHRQLLQEIQENPGLKKENPRWYVGASAAWRRAKWHMAVVERYEHQKTNPLFPVEVHVIRLGDMAFATNRFELYLDFGVQIKVRSPAIQTFLVQLAGGGTYLPSLRSVQGGGYGSVPASNTVGPQAGQELVEHTLQKLRELFL